MPWLSALVLPAAVAADLLAGEPPAMLHPVVWMGRMQRFFRKRAPAAPAKAFAYGLLMAIAGPLLFGGGSFLALRALSRWPLVEAAAAIYLLKSSFAIRALARAAGDVARALRNSDLPAARLALRSLVSRDTSALPAPLLAAAAVESVAENASDSVIGPLFFFLVAGVPGALAYRAANTLDSIIGYHGETEWLGKAAARLDDALNLIPARLTAALFILASAVCGDSARGAVRVFWRDASVTESPNAGRPMAAMAGALGVQLEKVGYYILGKGGALPQPEAIDRSVRLLLVVSTVAVVAVFLIGLGLHAHAPS